MMFRGVGALGCSEYWGVGILGCRNNGVSEQWGVGTMGCRNKGVSEQCGAPGMRLFECCRVAATVKRQKNQRQTPDPDAIPQPKGYDCLR